MAQTQVFGEFAHEREYKDDTQDLTMNLNSLPDNHFTQQGINVGVSLDF